MGPDTAAMGEDSGSSSKSRRKEEASLIRTSVAGLMGRIGNALTLCNQDVEFDANPLFLGSVE